MRCRSLRGFYGVFSPKDNGGGGGVMHQWESEGDECVCLSENKRKESK